MCWLHPRAVLGLGCLAGRSPGRENWLAEDPASSKELVAQAGNCCVPEPQPLLEVPLVWEWCGQSCGTQPHRTCRTTAKNQPGIVEMQVLAVVTCKGTVLWCPSTASPELSCWCLCPPSSSSLAALRVAETLLQQQELALSLTVT